MEVTLNGELNDTIVKQMVHGPDVQPLFTLFENVTAPTETGVEADLMKMIKDAELSVANATRMSSTLMVYLREYKKW